LRGGKIFSNLFDNGQSFFQAPYKVFWLKVNNVEEKFKVQFAVSAPKKRFKSAVCRNLLKRRSREAYRTNKRILYKVINENEQVQVQMIVVYSCDQMLPYADLVDAMKKILQLIADKLKIEN